MKKEILTPTQADIYAYIAGYIIDNELSPTSQEIAMKTGLTTQAIDSHLRNIAKKGWLKFNGKKHRRLELIPKK